MRHVLGLDHVVILVRDLDDADARMARLGFRPTPRGLHSAHMGTANATVVLSNRTYFETMTVLRATPANAELGAALAEREGLFGLACKTDAAHAAAEEFAAAGIAAGGALAFTRPVELPEGARDACFTIARVRAEATPGTSLFVCQHHTPDIVWREDHLEQPNGATGIVEVIGIADDLGSVEDAYGVIFGERCRRAADRVTIAAGNAKIVFLSPGAFVARFGALGEPVSSPRPRLAALRVRVRAFDALQRVLRLHGVPWSDTDGPSLLVGAEAGCGTLFEFAP
ncbi:MAG TPA: VOC family protein [Geminicoccaceae bacterium]|nr:VOC family protein [Geminicoccaceae bacterium]